MEIIVPDLGFYTQHVFAHITMVYKKIDVIPDTVTDKILSTIYHSYVLPKTLLLIKF